MKKLLIITIVLTPTLIYFFISSKQTQAQVCLPLNGYIVWPGTWEPGRVPMASNSQYTLTGSPLFISGGNVGIGTTIPAYKLQVNGDISGTRLCIGSDCRNVWPGGGITGTGSAGQVTFWTTTGNVSGENNLFWDYTNKRLGIATTNPSERLHVVGNAIVSGTLTAGSISGTYTGTINAANVSAGQFGANTGGGNYYFMGNVGIGTTAPEYKLDVNGNLRIPYGSAILSGPSSWPNNKIIETGWNNSLGQDYLYIYTSGASSLNSNPKIAILMNGNVGIGTTAPSYKLHVQGGDIYSSGYVRGGTGLCIGSDCRTVWPSGTITGVYAGAGLTGGGSSGSVTLSLNTAGISTCTGSTQKIIWDSTNNRLTCATDQTGSGGVGGSGTTSYIPLWTGSTSLGNSVIYQSGSNVGIGTTAPQSRLSVGGSGVSGAGIYGSGSDTGVYGYGSNYGIAGYGGNGGVYASGATYGVLAFSTGSTGYGVSGSGNIGIYGYGNYSGVSGYGITYGVYGNSNASSGYGVYGYASGSGGTGVYGGGSLYGVYGYATSYGVYGYASGGTGVYGQGNNYGVYGVGVGSGGIGVLGSGNTYGVYGWGNTYGVYGRGGTYDFYGYGGEYGRNGTWYNASDKNLKENFASVDKNEILSKILSLPITRWNYKTDPKSKHIGPVGQDWFAIFQLGESSTSIAATDMAGVSLVGIQALYDKIQDQQKQIKDQQKQIQALKQIVCQDHPNIELCKE